jgi:phage tail sheath protein FI
MPDYTAPGVYVEEVPSLPRTISGVDTSTAAFIGRTPKGPLANASDGPVQVVSLHQFQRDFGAIDPACPLTLAVRDFYANGGTRALVARLHAGTPQQTGEAGPPLQEHHYLGDRVDMTGLHALRKASAFNLLCIPPDSVEGDTAPAVYQAALDLCVERGALLLVDPPAAWNDPVALLREGVDAAAVLDMERSAARNAALYVPRLRQPHPSLPGQTLTCVPCGAVAGVIARTDANRGVWKAPAGPEADVRGSSGLSVALDDADSTVLNPVGVNCLRAFPVQGTVVWGARTLRGADVNADDYKYIPVRRTALFIEHSVQRGIAWAVFEPNAEPLWAQLRATVSTFLHALFVQGAFQGTSPRDAYFVRCDAGTQTQAGIDQGLCRVVIGFAPLKPAEFIVLQLLQMTRRDD